MSTPRIRFRPFRLALWVLVLAGGGAAIVRYLYGLGAVSNLSDRFPWGLWIGFDVMSGVALAAGGFTIAAAVHVFKLHRYHALLRPAVLTGFLGYLLVIAALLVDLGRPWNIWHPVVMWNPHSVMFEVAWCVMLYTLVLALEFGQVILQRFRLWTFLRVTQLALPPLVIAGVLLSTLHQSSLGSLFLIVPEKLHPLWYTSLLPILFFISAVAVGLAMVTVEATLAARAFRHRVDISLFTDLGRASAVVLSLYLGVKVVDLVTRQAVGLVFAGGIESVMFLVEVVGGVVLPLVLLAIPGVARSLGGLAAASWLVVGGVVLNRLNVAITGMLAGSGAHYVPAWTEVLITAAIVSGGILAYIYIVERLPILEHAEEPAPTSTAALHMPEAAP
ncbi:MAG: Ni/Fe-hydrogenase cytochrome b subunit [Armatimonadota bacterium]|nr:Ni/Fe-hydrogenase cytochrome b subunit [Armatimonadota bacterium]MDR7450832.1 Ni/Fe-hydrogenase cytochrome b subunit [Armatimonadota bacterium]MDR7465753.1 Ni/Fe-hydrogenase cytochrome b subunit [Armatimonadota bacterium]MDR7493661.1 Ni/Fe-hydrogenase cytochrome b subunit [Armatimonadota bacterium]MDR7499090.1 Ni/Fe-hydrogenase cytochrome b subunit [Armatimonadota bacterium]